ncbi:hypothetical protein RhiirA5_435567 [Rhizophagus irregularis]|uniref:Uncharacterized protein n=1 Tax=Rhizophagus irregularis TaxID=588596 RepID=A0A2N0NN79_9GLOM|nr:hypothetical protein RhiirA5_435567 [Rhizophagus irregularis]
MDLFNICRCPIGVDVAVSTGVQNQRSMVAQNNILAAAYYDFTKLCLMPSVTFFISIPNDISESFYDGQVFVSYKNTIFEPILPPILCLYTGGGPTIAVIMDQSL